MFTGIVDHIGKITAIETVEAGLQFTLETSFTDLVPGESISVDGACLTVVSPAENLFRVALSSETCAKTLAKQYAVGRAVNLERAMRAQDRFGGHYVTGHVEQTAQVTSVTASGDCVEMHFSGILPEYQAYLIAKGSICLNGVSLTLNTVYAGGFSVMLIPHTLESTNLKYLQIKTAVNIEFDWMVKVLLTKSKQYEELTCNV